MSTIQDDLLLNDTEQKDSDSDEERNEKEMQYSIAKLLSHFDQETSGKVRDRLFQSATFARYLYAIMLGSTPATQSVELLDEELLYSRGRHLPQRHDSVVRDEWDKML